MDAGAEGQSSAVNTLGNWCLTLYGETEEGKALIQWLGNGMKPRTSPSAYESCLPLTEISGGACPGAHDKPFFFR